MENPLQLKPTPTIRPALRLNSQPVVDSDISTSPTAYSSVPPISTRAGPYLSAIIPVNG